jgi:muramoyltetrapeptide carboxypeptidase
MRNGKIKIGIVAPGSRIDAGIAGEVMALADFLYPKNPPNLYFHPQCFLSSGHFAGDDETRARAFLEVANDRGIDALWFARGGYGSGRLAECVLAGLTVAAGKKTYIGYSDTGFLLAGLYHAGVGEVLHGPMPSDIARSGGDAAVRRALAFLIDRAPDALEATVSPTSLNAAFNITVLSHLIGTPLQPDLAGHVLMLEEVAEQMYRIDRAVFQITNNIAMRQVAGIRLGRCSAIPPNQPDFAQTEEEVVRYWCARSGIPYLGQADIGHDINNKVVPFGRRQGA